MISWYKIAQEEALDDDLLKPFDSDAWKDVESSFINAIAYYEAAAVLEVRLNSGKKYTFMGVPQDVYEAFMKSPSKGEYFNRVIRKRYTGR